MSRKLKRSGVAFITVVALALVLAAPAHAAGLSDWGKVPTVFHQAWQWIAKVLPGGARPRALSGLTAQRATQEKVKMGVDPNGVDTTSSTPADGDKGAGVDPNG